MAVPTIEEFIERSKVNCEAAARLTVKRRYIDALPEGTSAEDAAARAQEYLESAQGQQEYAEALNAGKFYKALISENAASEPKVVDSYRKYVTGMPQKGAVSTAVSRSAKRREQRKRKKAKAKAGHKKYFEIYQTFVFSPDDEQIAFDLAADMIREFYSDVRNIVTGRLMKDVYSEFVSRAVQTKFQRVLNDEASLNPRRIDAIISRVSKIYGSLNELIMGTCVDIILADSGYIPATINGIKREFLTAYCPQYPKLSAMYDRLRSMFGRDALTEIIHSGSEYRKAVGYMEKQINIMETAHELILREIPDNAIDLYPNARGIERRFILHLGPTNSGKTYSSLQACMRAETGVYLAPLRLLAYEICEKFNIEGVPCRMKTGEEEIDVPFASHTSSTVEMLDVNEHYDVAVVDECQLIEDEERGGAWTAAILGLVADEIHLCASENAENILIKLIEMCGDSYEIVYHERSVPLVPDKRDFVFPRDVEPNDALIAFSKRSVLNYAEQLRALGIRASVIYGDLPYDVRRNEVSRFIRGETDVVVATDAVGMGLNLPIKRVVFLETYKYDGRRRRFLHGTEVKQIAGRAGRMGMYDVGYFNSAEFKGDIIKKLRKPSHDVRKARLRIPESIIAVDMKLSDILLRWGTIPDDDIFTRNNVEREVALSRELERYSSDKLLIYRFITIPFSETRRELYEYWLDLFMAEIYDDRSSSAAYAGAIRRELDSVSDEMTGLERNELAYRKCDILYFYFDRFGVKEDLEVIMDLKHLISLNIMNYLSGQD